MMDDKPKKDYWEKTSWRERDDKNKKSPHGIKEQPSSSFNKPNSLQKRQETLAKKDLEDLFTPKASKEETKAWTAVTQQSGSGFSKAASEFVDKHGYPKDWNDQIKLLDHSDTEFVSKLLSHMHGTLSEQTPTKKELFQGKLKVLLAACDDYGLSKTIQGILTTEFPA